MPAGRQASTMLGLLTKKLKNHSIHEIKPADQTKVTGFASSVANFETGDNTNIKEGILIQEIDNKKEKEKEKEGNDGSSSNEKSIIIIKNTCENKENIVCVKEITPIQKLITINNNNNNIEYQLDRNIEKKGDGESKEKDCSSSPVTNVIAPQQQENCNHEIDYSRKHTGEKRKFSRTSLCQYRCSKVLPLPTYHGDSSSDEEMKELYSKHKCYTSSKGKVVNCSTSDKTRKIVCLNGADVQRPSLNFDKMQQLGKKKSRPRVVKLKHVWNLNPKLLEKLESQSLPSLKSRGINDLVSFKPINLFSAATSFVSTSNVGSSGPGVVVAGGIFSSNVLVPVEEPFQNGCVY